MPEDHEGRAIYGERPDPTPELGRALGRLEEREGRKIEKKKAGGGGPVGGGEQSCC